ncbi:tape-measure protein [Streptomyces sp. TRM70308]|uniref:tape-measure protein n=1 Tax=Streptomyces sp. TRM70308 TaxID=3131932 RepID=UPI003D05A5A8
MAIAMLAQAGPGFRTFGGALGQARSGLAANRRAIEAASRAAGAIRGGAQRTQAELRRVVPSASLAGQGLLGFGRRAGAVRPQLDVGRAKFKATNRELKRLQQEAGRSDKLAGGIGKSAGIVGKLGGVFGIGLKLGAGVMKLVNTVMKANPWGLVLTLVAPLVVYLVDAAMQSTAGQKIIQTVSTVVMQTVETVLKVIMPVVTVVAKIAITYIQGYLTVITTVVRWIANAARDPMGTMRRVVGGVGDRLRSLADRAFGGLRDKVSDALEWIRTKPREMFDRVLGAMRGTLGGIAGFLETGMQLVLDVVKGPVNGVIGFANRAIDGLNSLSVNVLGKKFGVNLSKIPQLAHGGVVLPRRRGVPAIVAEAGEAEAVVPLPVLRRLMDRTARHAASTAARGGWIEHYAEPAERGPLGVAEDLLFLARAERQRWAPTPLGAAV